MSQEIDRKRNQSGWPNSFSLKNAFLWSRTFRTQTLCVREFQFLSCIYKSALQIFISMRRANMETGSSLNSPKPEAIIKIYSIILIFLNFNKINSARKAESYSSQIWSHVSWRSKSRETIGIRPLVMNHFKTVTSDRRNVATIWIWVVTVEEAERKSLKNLWALEHKQNSSALHQCPSCLTSSKTPLYKKTITKSKFKRNTWKV